MRSCKAFYSYHNSGSKVYSQLFLQILCGGLQAPGGGGEGALSVSFSVCSYVRPYVRLSVRPSQNVKVFARSLYVVSPPTSGREDH